MIKTFLLGKQVLLKLIFLLFVIATISAIDAQEITTEKISIIGSNGHYGVGHVFLDLIDTNRNELATENPSDLREIPIQIWYPISKTTQGEKSKYRPRVEAFRLSWGDDSVDFINQVSTSIIENATISSDGPFDVFLFSHGWGARSSSHTTFLSNLAGQGYIVIGINHPYMGKVVLSNGEFTEPTDSHFLTQEDANQYYANDVIYVTNYLEQLNRNDPNGRFTDAINLNHIIAGGHSSGFPAVSAAAVNENKIKGLISFDSGVPKVVRRKGLDVPLLLFRAEKNSYTDLFFRGINVHPKGTIYDVDFFRVHKADFYDLVIAETTHSSIYDEYIFSENEDERGLSLRNHSIILNWTREFLIKVFDKGNSLLLENKIDSPYTKLRVIKAFQLIP